MKFEIAQNDKDRHFEFWHALNGLAAICDFGDITTTLVLDMFILHMNNKKVQKLCTEPKEPDQALEFAIAFEEGIKRQKAYGVQVSADPAKVSVKREPVFAVEKSNSRECFRGIPGSLQQFFNQF